MRMMQLFLDVATLRSVSRAAEIHGVTQSAVSQRVRNLEAELGVLLLDRSVRPLALTPAGEVYASEARELLERYQRLIERIGELRRPPEGEIRVAAIYSAGIDLMQALREGFESIHPTLRVILEYKRPEDVDQAVRSAACDFGIVSYPKRWQGLATKALRDERMTIVCPPGHPLLKRKVVQAKVLGKYSMLCFTADLPVGRHIRRYLRSHGVPTTFAYEADNVDTMKSMLAIGDQVAILPRRTVAREVAAGTLAIADLKPELNRPIGIIYPRRPRLSAPAREFLSYLLEHADPDAPLLTEEPRQVSLAS